MRIRNFLETAINPKFKTNKYHAVLYSWYVDNKIDVLEPSLPPYFAVDFFDSIKSIKDEGLLNLKTMSSKMWYRALLENNVTHHTMKKEGNSVPVGLN